MKIITLVTTAFLAVLSTARFIAVLSIVGLLTALSAAGAADLPRKEPPPVSAAPIGKYPVGKYPVGKYPAGKYPQPVVTKGGLQQTWWHGGDLVHASCHPASLLQAGHTIYR